MSSKTQDSQFNILGDFADVALASLWSLMLASVNISDLQIHTTV